MENESTDCKSPSVNIQSPINATHLPMNNKASQVIKWIKVTHTKSNRIQWKPIFIIRSSAPNRKDCKYRIGKTTNNEYKTYRVDELYDSPDAKCSKQTIIHTLLKSLHTLFTENTINDETETPLYLYNKTDNAHSLFSRFNIFKSSKNELLSLNPIKECEFHESSGIDEYDRKVTGIWIKTNENREKIYMSIDKVKTIRYIDDVNPVKYKTEDEWVIVNEEKQYEDVLDIDIDKEVTELRVRHSDSLKVIEALKVENNENQKQNEILSSQMSELNEILNKMQNADKEAKLNKKIALQKSTLDEKQKEIDRLRRELIARSNAKQLNSKFATIEEVCAEYRSIKNQEFQSVHSKLSKPLRKRNKGWNKYYVNKMSHKLLFETLRKCSTETLRFHDDIYHSIGDILQISYVEQKEQCSDDDKNEEKDNNKTLEFLFHRYLTNNYDTMRESAKFKEMMDNIFSYCAVEYKDIISALSDDEEEELNAALKVYINKCCDVCWNMVLQRPKLSISPFEFVSKDLVEFDEEKHTRILGSNKKDQYVLYFVWPGIAHNDVQLDNVKIYVLQRDTDFCKTKK